MKKLYVLFFAAVLMVMGLIAAVYGEDALPGSEQDPLVTKSYVDSFFDSIKDRLSALEKDKNEEDTGTVPVQSAGWEVVKILKGQKVSGAAGTQIILRSGSASAVDNGKNGISDLTGGSDLRMGENVEKNHLLLVPGADGRGILCSSDSYIMVQGEYIVE